MILAPAWTVRNAPTGKAILVIILRRHCFMDELSSMTE
jgi:hypothetical protein